MRKDFLFLLVFALGAAVSSGYAQEAAAEEPSPPAPAETPASEAANPEARSKALELAGAFTNEGFTIRDGHWSAKFEPNGSQIVEVNLFRDNEYWFCVGGAATARKIEVKVFDETGQPVESSNYQEGATAAAGIVAPGSGKYYIQITLVEGDASDLCLVYTFK